jgi:hypothetical protein
MSPETCLSQVIRPAFCLLPSPLRGAQAAVMVLAIMGQESGLAHREQVGGPAHGLAQFEKGGGVRGVLKHRASAGYARTLCEHYGVPATEAAVYWALVENDELAAGFARLLLWTDPLRLPAIGDEDGAFDYYHRCWRPGAYDRGDEAARAKIRARWGEHYAAAVKAVAP